MLIIISPHKNNKSFSEAKNDNKILFLDKICHLKKIKDKNNILLINCNLLNDNGIIELYNFCLEEVFISLKINIVISINSNNKIQEICDFYQINLINI